MTTHEQKQWLAEIILSLEHGIIHYQAAIEWLYRLLDNCFDAEAFHAYTARCVQHHLTAMSEDRHGASHAQT